MTEGYSEVIFKPRNSWRYMRNKCWLGSPEDGNRGAFNVKFQLAPQLPWHLQDALWCQGHQHWLLIEYPGSLHQSIGGPDLLNTNTTINSQRGLRHSYVISLIPISKVTNHLASFQPLLSDTGARTRENEQPGRGSQEGRN